MPIIYFCRNSAAFPEIYHQRLSPVRTVTGTLCIEIGEVAVGSMHYSALFAVAVVLLAITLIVNLSAVAILKHIRSKHGAEASGRTLFSPESERLKLVFRAVLVLLAVLIVMYLFAPLTAIALLASLGFLLLVKNRISPTVS